MHEITYTKRCNVYRRDSRNGKIVCIGPRTLTKKKLILDRHVMFILQQLTDSKTCEVNILGIKDLGDKQ